METNGDPAFEATVQVGQRVRTSTPHLCPPRLHAVLSRHAAATRSQAACFKNLNFRLRIQEDTYNDETRIKTTVRSIEPVDYVKASKARS